MFKCACYRDQRMRLDSEVVGEMKMEILIGHHNSFEKKPVTWASQISISIPCHYHFESHGVFSGTGCINVITATLPTLPRLQGDDFLQTESMPES